MVAGVVRVTDAAKQGGPAAVWRPAGRPGRASDMVVVRMRDCFTRTETPSRLCKGWGRKEERRTRGDLWQDSGALTQAPKSSDPLPARADALTLCRP